MLGALFIIYRLVSKVLVLILFTILSCIYLVELFSRECISPFNTHISLFLEAFKSNA